MVVLWMGQQFLWGHWSLLRCSHMPTILMLARRGLR
jgi:hypothetical protein